MTKPLVAYVGMTHLGLLSGVAAAAQGFHTVCFDPDADRIAALNRGELPVVEPGLPELLAANRDRLLFTADPTALGDRDLVYVAPDVPTDDRGISDLGPIERLLASVEPALRRDAAMVILSQVPPGFTRAHPRPSGAPLYYQVETLVFGCAVERATRPERFIVGCADPAAALHPALDAFLRSFGCPILPMRPESAELAKISINCCLVASVTTANTLAELCERIGADWSEIAPALKLDRRIGAYAYLSPGLGIAGGNLERDLATVLRFAERHDADAGVVAAWVANSRHRKDWSFRTVKAEALDRNPRAKIAVLGLAYKENTHSIKNSPSIDCLVRLEAEGADVAVFDPVVKGSTVPFARDATSALDCVQGADVLMILTPWPEFKALAPADLAAAMAGRLVIDPYRCLSPAAATQAGLDYITLGVPPIRTDSVPPIRTDGVAPNETE